VILFIFVLILFCHKERAIGLCSVLPSDRSSVTVTQISMLGTLMYQISYILLRSRGRNVLENLEYMYVTTPTWPTCELLFCSISNDTIHCRMLKCMLMCVVTFKLYSFYSIDNMATARNILVSRRYNHCSMSYRIWAMIDRSHSSGTVVPTVRCFKGLYLRNFWFESRTRDLLPWLGFSVIFLLSGQMPG
jgi:hypothetical protein